MDYSLLLIVEVNEEWTELQKDKLFKKEVKKFCKDKRIGNSMKLKNSHLSIMKDKA
jgi:hypothetical protein